MKRQQRLEVGLRAEEVRLEHGADALVPCFPQAPVDAERRVEHARLLHVDPDEALEALGDLDHALDVRVGELLVELEPEVCQLQRDVARELLRVEALEDAPVLLGDGLRLGWIAHALAEQRRVRVETLVRQAPQYGDALVQRLARDEPRRAQPHPVLAHEAPHVAVVGRAQDHRAQHRVGLLRDAQATAAPSSSSSHASSAACSASSRSRNGGRT